MIRRPPRSTQSRSSAASDVYKRQRADRHWGNPNGRGDLGVSHTVGGHQQHFGPFHLTMGRGRGPGQYGQRLTLTGGHDQWGCGIVHANSLPKCGYLFWRHTTSSVVSDELVRVYASSTATTEPGEWAAKNACT